jgi:adenosylcobinamide hydrolase
MRYYLRDSSLIIRGKFRICSSGTNGGVRSGTTLINHQVDENFSGDPGLYIELLSLLLGLSPQNTSCLLTAVPMKALCIMMSESLTTFITAGVKHQDSDTFEGSVKEPSVGTINIILVMQEPLSDQGLIDAMITATEAKALALVRAGYSCMGTPTDAVITATELEGNMGYAGSATRIGQRIHEAVSYGTSEALLRWSGKTERQSPSLFICSSIGGNHWVEWQKKNCPYYPCHFKGQRCDFCYCPLYPCRDLSLGDWLEKPGGSNVWNCARCTLNHTPEVVSHLKRNPEASINELKAIYYRNQKIEFSD